MEMPAFFFCFEPSNFVDNCRSLQKRTLYSSIIAVALHSEPHSMPEIDEFNSIYWSSKQNLYASVCLHVQWEMIIFALRLKSKSIHMQ